MQAGNENAYTVLVGIPERGNRNRTKDIKIDLKEA
jgi:hypothetical protein